MNESSRRRKELTSQIQAIHARKYDEVYGSPRLRAELAAQGGMCNRKTVAKCMKEAGIKAATVKTFRVITTDSDHPLPVAANLVDRDFAPSGKIKHGRLTSRPLRRTRDGFIWMPPKICTHAR